MPFSELEPQRTQSTQRTAPLSAASSAVQGVRQHRRAAVIAGVLLLAIYLGTLAPDVTFWDAGELASAAHVLGIPHPPGTPLWIAIAHVWASLLAPFGLATAPALNLLSAVATALACAITAWMVARWLAWSTSGIAAALGAGGMATIWLNATETEVYAASLLLGVVALACAERRGAGGDARWLAAAAYCLGLAVPLHLSALVVAPGVVVLAARRDHGALFDLRDGWRIVDALALGGATLTAMGLGTVSALPCVVGGVVLAVAAVIARRGVMAGDARARDVALVALAVMLAASATLLMLVRARHDPVINQGDPSTWARFTDVVARRQYSVAPLFPREAPVWMQLANVLQYAELQVALGLSAMPTVSPLRALAAIAWIMLAIVGARAHRRVHPRSWLAMLVLLVAGSLGVAAQLNLKAGPTIGWGILPDAAPHEARERDYFFTVAWWTWGAWAGIGAVALARARDRTWLALLALMPLALNLRGVSRRREPEGSLPRRLALAMLESAPRGAVLFVRGDNDSYPLWYEQVARGVRRDVTTVTVPLLAATWYRAELARRAQLLDASQVARWTGERDAQRAIAANVARLGRPIAVSAAMPRAEREAVAGEGTWRLDGLVWTWSAGHRFGTEPPFDASVATRVLPWARDVDLPDAGPSGGIAPAREPVGRWARRLLNCPVAVVALSDRSSAASQLDSLCNVR